MLKILRCHVHCYKCRNVDVFFLFLKNFPECTAVKESIRFPKQPVKLHRPAIITALALTAVPWQLFVVRLDACCPKPHRSSNNIATSGEKKSWPFTERILVFNYSFDRRSNVARLCYTFISHQTMREQTQPMRGITMVVVFDSENGVNLAAIGH